MPSQTSTRAGGAHPNRPRRPRRRLSKKQRQMYRRRRIVALAAALTVLALAAFCVYSLVRGAAAAPSWIGAGERMAVARSAVPAPAKKSKVRACSAKDIKLDLTPSATVVGVGGSLEFTAKIAYIGDDPAGCYVDGADDARVLRITSGDDVVWRSDACRASWRPLLMMDGASDEAKIVWNTDRTGSECVADDQLPRVGAGTYVAQLSLADDPKVVSDPVTVTVQ